MKRGFIAFLMCMVFVVSSSAVDVLGTQPFSQSIRKEFYDFIVWARANDYRSYNRFTLHDFDGDGIPEVMFGKTDESNSRFIWYDVVRYSKKDFKKIGTISLSRYLIKDRYSYAILGLYGAQTTGLGVTTELNNFYIHNGTIQKNTVLHTTGSAYYKNNIPIAKEDYDNEMFNYLGSYDELIVHDSYNLSVVMSAVYSWKQVVLSSAYGAKLKSPIMLNKTWQVAYNTSIGQMTGPVDTYQEPYELPRNLSNARYTRFALHDFTGDGAPELLIGVNHGTQVSIDVYKYMNGEVRFAGSFDGYAKYISKFPDSNDVFSYDPIDDMFNYQTVNRVYSQNNALNLNTIMSCYAPIGKPNTNVWEINDSAVSMGAYNDKLISYINNTTEIKTFDIEFVPVSAVLTNWRPMK